MSSFFIAQIRSNSNYHITLKLLSMPVPSEIQLRSIIGRGELESEETLA